jgi:hypothetical protein
MMILEKIKSFYDAYHANGHNNMSKYEFSDGRVSKFDGKVELKFQIYHGRIRAKLHNVGHEESIISGIWTECTKTATFVSNSNSNSYCLSVSLRSLKIFRRMGIRTDDIQENLENYEVTCMFLG